MEFNGQQELEDFNDWLISVEDVLEFKDVPSERRVPLVATGSMVGHQAGGKRRNCIVIVKTNLRL